MESLFDLAYSGPALSNGAGTGQWTFGDVFTGVPSSEYWSSTTYTSIRGSAWSVHVNNGFVVSAGKSSYYWVWPVRSRN